MPTNKADQLALRERYRELMKEVWDTPRMVDFCVSEVARFVPLPSGCMLTIRKPRIETMFCFGYSLSRHDNDDYDRAERMASHAAKDEEYFKRQNLKDLQEIIDMLGGNADSRLRPYLQQQYDKLSSVVSLSFARPLDMQERGIAPLSEADRAAVLDAYKLEYAAFEKRLNTYLKRYGMRKVKSWSYWRDE